MVLTDSKSKFTIRGALAICTARSNLEAVADIRWLGAQKLSSLVLDYEAASVVAAKTPKIGVSSPAAAALE